MGKITRKVYCPHPAKTQTKQQIVANRIQEVIATHHHLPYFPLNPSISTQMEKISPVSNTACALMTRIRKNNTFV